MTAAFANAFGQVADRKNNSGDYDAFDEPDPNSITAPGIQWPNSGWSDNISVNSSGDTTYIDVNLTVSYKGLSPAYVDDAIAEIGSNWSVTRGDISGRSYSMRVNLTRIDSGTGDLQMNLWRRAPPDVYASSLTGGPVMKLTTSSRAMTHAHEFGHNLGFRHQWNFTGSMMSYGAGRSAGYQDLQSVARTYGGN